METNPLSSAAQSVAPHSSSLGVAATSYRGLVSDQEARTLNCCIDSFHSIGAQMGVSSELGGIPRVRPLLTDASMRWRLERDIRDAGWNADLQLHEVRQVGESLTRSALRTERSCEARHLEQRAICRT